MLNEIIIKSLINNKCKSFIYIGQSERKPIEKLRGLLSKKGFLQKQQQRINKQ